jgi:hypothetical protein
MAFRPVCTGWLDRLAPDDARRDLLDRRAELGLDRALAVERLAERIDDAAEHRLADRHLEDAARRLDRVALGDVQVVAEHHRADRVLLEVQRQAEGVARELEHLAVGGVRQPVDAHDAVRHRDHGADIAGDGRGLELEDLLFDQVADFRCLDGHFLQSFSA